MIFTRLAWLFGLLFFAALCWLAIRGLTIVVPFLVTGLVLILLVGGGNALSGRSSPPSGRGHSGRGDQGESR